MPGVLTHKSIMLLARERIRLWRDLLADRLTSGGRLTDLEHRLFFLASKAYEMMSGPPVPSVDFPGFPQHPFSGVNKFAVMGSMGPDFTAFSAVLAPGQGCVFATVHKGSPDENRELVVARTTDFIFAFYPRAIDALHTADRAGSLGDGGLARGVKAMQGYVLGHLCHIAGDAISHPYVNDVEWHQGTGLHPKFSHAGGEGSIEAEVARQVLLRRSTREGQTWEAWWPTVDEVPDAFYSAYADALEFTYKVGTRPPADCFGEFLERFADLAPPTVDAGFVRDGYHLYRNGILGYGYGHGLWGWTVFLIWLGVPLVALFPIAAALPRTAAMFRPGFLPGAAWVDFLNLVLGIASPFVLGYSVWLILLTRLGVENRALLGGLSAGINLLLAGFVVADQVTGFLPSWLRLLFLLVPTVVAATFATFGVTDLARSGRRARGGAMLVFSLPAIYLLVALLLYAVFFLGERELLGDSTTRIVYLVVVTVLLAAGLFVGVALGLARFVRDVRVPEVPAGFPAEERHFVRLFDDASLFEDADGGLFYPAAGRALLKLWWDGAGDLYLRSRRYQLEWSFDGTTTHQTVAAPIAPTTAAEYGQFLTATVNDPGGATGHLHAALAFPQDPDVRLPPGAVFADHADDLETADEEARALAAAQFVKLGTSEGAAFVLRHAPKAAQAVRFGPAGPAILTRAGEEPVAGSGTVTSSGTTVTGSGTHFRALFQPQDFLRVLIDDTTSRSTRVVTVVSDTELTVAPPLDPAVDSGKPYQRWGSSREATQGFRYIADPVEEQPGDAVMDYAADFAAILCLGAVPSLVDVSVAPSLLNQQDLAGNAVPANLGAVGQAFRNWCIDRRRVNEWRMLVAGGAVSEKAGHPELPDRAMPRPSEPGWHPDPAVAGGERLANALGWVPLLRQWMDLLGDLARDPAAAGGDALAAAARRPDVPANAELSRAVAFLFDLPNPAVLR